jgi:FAD/FMN-containing dehydrogenase/ferredoxin
MTSFWQNRLGTDLESFWKLPRDRAAALMRDKIPDLLHFLARPERGGREPGASRRMAVGLEAHVSDALTRSDLEQRHLHDRIVIDGFVRSELDRDQNVYLGKFFTRVLSRAVPDVVFQPANPRELELALEWARKAGVGLATRGAGSTAMGGAVPANGGLLLEMSRFDQIQIDAKDGMAVIGAGARMKDIHARLAAHGLALKTYPSNLGGTLAGWFCTGGLGLNTFKHGAIQNQVRALAVVLPRGENVRFHDDGRIDAQVADGHQRLTPENAEAWLAERGYPPLRLQDFAQTEGQFGILHTFTVETIPLPEFRPFYFEFEQESDALHFVQWITEGVQSRRCPPANLKYLSGSHVEAVRRVRGDADPAGKPAVYVDFDAADEAQRFEAGLAAGKWQARNQPDEAKRWFADRFRPQQTKRLGPGFIAAEVLLPSRHVEPYLQRAAKLAARVGVHLETEVYFFGDGGALALPGYLTAGPRSGFVFELALAPVLVDLAMSRYDGEPYVLGRWQSPFFRARFKAGASRQLRRAKKRTDPKRVLNPGVFFGPGFRIAGASGVYRATFPGGIRMLRLLYGSPLAGIFRALIRNPHAHGPKPHAALSRADRDAVDMAATLERLRLQTRGCVNCGECNSVCPVFHDAKIRLPQMLTHIGEKLQAKGKLKGTQQLLLDLCMRCGNCEKVCQADIPHLDLYAAMERQAGAYEGERRERHAAVLAHLRYSERYLRDFLHVRAGGYLQRTPASLPGDLRYLVLRAENDAGAESTCIHCGACVPVCPTSANSEYGESSDLRRISSDMSLCVGCGTCVEVCPANLANGGQTLRVMEAPTRAFFNVMDDLDPQPKVEEPAGTAAGGKA